MITIDAIKGSGYSSTLYIFEEMKGNILLFEKDISWLSRPPLAFLASSGARPGQGFSNISLCLEC